MCGFSARQDIQHFTETDRQNEGLEICLLQQL